jgi:hypothetical protein
MSHYCWWNRHVANPIKFQGFTGKGRSAMLLLKNTIMPRILMRRTKVQCADDLALPPRCVWEGREIAVGVLNKEAVHVWLVLPALAAAPTTLPLVDSVARMFALTCALHNVVSTALVLPSSSPLSSSCRTLVLRKDRFDASEADFYEALYTQSRATFGAYVTAGTLLNNYAHIFDLLIR